MRVAFIAAGALAIAATPAHGQDPVLVAAGDIACDPASPNYNDGDGTTDPAPGKCHQKHTADLIAPLAPTWVLPLGDLQYEDGALHKFQESYEESWGRSDIKARTKPVPGNHEYGSGMNSPGQIHHDANATGYFTYFASQLAAEGPDAGDPRKGWYSYDVQAGATSWHIVALNSECAAGLASQVGWEGGCAAGSDQERWLRADLASNNSDCTLAYWHHPLFSAAGGHDEMVPIWDALYEDYADVVLVGHRHTYERFSPQDSEGTARPGRGIRSWVVGTGGKEPHNFTLGSLPNTETRDNATHGVLKLTLHGAGPAHPYGWYQWQFVNDGASGSTYTDSGSADCVGPPRPSTPPATAATTAATTTTAAARDTLAPLVSLARLSRRRFRLGSRTVIGFTLSEAATATLRFDRRRRIGGRVRHRRVATLRRTFGKGRTRLRFSGRVGRRKLTPGLYRLSITAKDAAGNSGRPRRLFFRVLG